ncbi:MAG: response regulator [Myxococcota bacterium]|nr:response regulator [Myxococcota bacterium]
MEKKRVLIVDDAPLMRMVVQNILEGDPNLEVVGKARNGAEGLKQVNELKPDIVILDIEMPIMDGLTFLRHARGQFPGKILVLSAVTALGSSSAVEAKTLGADAVMSKPSGTVSLDLEERRGSELVKTIYMLLGLKHEKFS